MASKKTKRPSCVVNWADVDPIDYGSGEEHWGDHTQPLTPSMPRENEHFGINRVTLKPGRTSCPFHWHVREDEAYLILEGTGIVRYGDDVFDVRSGDCVSFPRNSGKGHQIANVSEADLVYLAIGENRKDEVAVYPDTGKVMLRALRKVVHIKEAAYMDGEPNPPRILGISRARAAGRRSTSRPRPRSDRGR